MIHYLTTGIVLGLSAGLVPGPLFALVISETLQNDMKAGIKVALAPILTDLPIIILTLLILQKLSGFHSIIGGISFFGGFVLLHMGYQNLRVTGADVNIDQRNSRSLRKGVIVNFLSPHPYLFWISVGAPITMKAMGQGACLAVAFVGSFYMFLVGSKIVLAILVGKSQAFLSGKVYKYTVRFLGAVLMVFALLLFRDGFKLIGIL